MKRFFRIGILALVLVLVSGCGSKGKVLTCKINEDTAGILVDSTIKVTFKENKATSINVVEELSIDEEHTQFLDEYKKLFDKQYEPLRNKSGFGYKVESKDKKVIVTLNVELKKIDEETKEKLDISNINGTYKEVKKDLEDAKYKCK